MSTPMISRGHSLITGASSRAVTQPDSNDASLLDVFGAILFALSGPIAVGLTVAVYIIRYS